MQNERMWEWAYVGINASLPGDGGPECAAYLSKRVIWVETVYTSILASLLIAWGWRHVTFCQPPDYKAPMPHRPVYTQRQLQTKTYLLLAYSFIWGVEVGFKFASQTVLYLFNPCHIVTMMQLYLLAAPPSKTASGWFRLHLNYLNGAILAFVFPVTDSRQLPFETVTYWLQHSMMLIVPAYLIKMKGVYTVESVRDFSWNALAYGFILFYHFIVLNFVGRPFEVNLNHMLCPLPADPFNGQWYRSAAVVHEALLCPLCSKMMCLYQDFINKGDIYEIESAKDKNQTAEKSRCGRAPGENGSATRKLSHVE
ncbi:transmembrane protein 164 isoform X1 [Neocloeon triangulifer]|uniref:transmembrane protein 164 isoform X1 n=2 Tax=Neocloeon triangulifer TaxID=2078957 RepID=UPI00286F08EE|nr:transmembrane protein 164 isoform X1 [Neocloeon triangulifer]